MGHVLKPSSTERSPSIRVLVTGAGGYLGTEIVKCLRLCGHEVLGLGRRPGLGIIECDMLDRECLRTVLHDFSPDIVIHTAAHVPRTLAEYRDPQSAGKSLQMIDNLLSLAAKSASMIYVSSMTVYGSEGRVKRRETDAGNPETPYGEGKWLGEELIRNSGRQAFAVRIPGLFGGQRKDGLVGNLMQACRDNSPPSLPNRPLLWAAMDVRDAAAGIAGLAGKDLSGFLPVNLGYPEVYSIPRFVTLASSIFGREINYRQKHPEFEFDLARARLLDLAPQTTLKNALIRLLGELS